MKLTEIKKIVILTSTEALVLKGGARDTRDNTTGTASTIGTGTSTNGKKG